MKRAIICVILAVSCLFGAAGCADMRDINDRAYVLGIGIDGIGGGKYRFSFCCYLPVSAGASVTGTKLASTVIPVEASSMAMAVRELNKSTSHEAVLEQLACIAISGTPDGEELERLLDYPSRHPQVRRQCVVVTCDSPAAGLLSADPGENSAPAEIASLLEQQDNSRRQSSSSALYRLTELLSDGCDFMLFRVGAERPDNTVSSADTHDTISITGADIYVGGRPSGRLGHDDTELARLFYDRQTSGIITVARRDGTLIYYEIKHSCCKLRFDPGGERPRFDIKLRIECMLVDSGGADSHTEDEIKRSLEEKLGALIEKCQSGLGSAPLGAQPAARQQDWRWYQAHREQWSGLFAESEITLDIDCMLDQDEAMSTVIRKDIP